MTPEAESRLMETDLDREIRIRQEKLTVLEPDFWRERPREAAEIMIKILSANYGTHNLANNVEALATDIGSGKVQPFIAFEKTGELSSCAALIKLSETDVELGRGACLPGKNGGNALPLLLAFKRWQEGAVFPESKVIRAEIRTAKPTKEVPGGQATQIVCLQKLGLIPTAIAPLFHHGNPDRQEMFFLASKFKNFDQLLWQSMPFPTVEGSMFEREGEEILRFFWQGFWGRWSNISWEKPTPAAITKDDCFKFEVREEGPLMVIKPTAEKTRTRVVASVRSFEHCQGRFSLAKIPLLAPTDQIKVQVRTLGDIGFRLMGFEPVLDSEEKLKANLLLGKLSDWGKERLVAPSFPEGLFSHRTEDFFLKDFAKWRILIPKGISY